MKKTNWIMPALMTLLLATTGFGVTGCKKAEPAQGDSKAVQYTCSMHPEVVKDAAGDCPKCGMKLVEKK